jgi:AcrR family transcriptional regulator
VSNLNGFELRRQKKINAIIQAATQLFCTHGINSVSIVSIAKKAAVSPVSIYNYFGSKENLVKQVIFFLMENEMQKYEKLFDDRIPFINKFENMFLNKMDAITVYSEEFLRSSIWKEPFVQDLLEQFFQTRTVPLMIKLIEQGKQEGYVNPDLSNNAVVLYMKMFKNELINMELSNKDRHDLTLLFFYGLLGKQTH